jgi:hypothetical protein
MWNLKFMGHKNHKKSALQSKKWRFFADYATFAETVTGPQTAQRSRGT